MVKQASFSPQYYERREMHLHICMHLLWDSLGGYKTPDKNE